MCFFLFVLKEKLNIYRYCFSIQLCEDEITSFKVIVKVKDGTVGGGAKGDTLRSFVCAKMTDGFCSVLLCVCSPVVSVCVCRRLLYTLVHLGDKQAVIHVDRVAEVATVLLLL